MDESTLRACLADLPIPALRYFTSTSSTNLDALAWAEAGAPDGALVVADEQTRGRGRLERRWITRPGAALAFSLVLRPRSDELAHTPLYSPLGALAVSEALTALDLPVQIKWPNDVLVAGRKVSGILAESVWQGETFQAAVIGIGVNVTPDALPPAEQLNFPATCLETELRQKLERTELLAAILHALFQWRPRLGSQQFLQAWEQRMAFRGELVRVARVDGGELVGRLAGVNTDGSLHLQLLDGSEERVLAGDVSLRPAA